MGIIHILPPHEALKIAAGEVVERPAHIVKELIENALDAQATVITLYIAECGKKLIRVVDNGVGMTSEDAELCFHPHATSKITVLEDLEGVATYGFRGEALASIAAVSNVVVTTKSRDTSVDALGISLTYTQGVVQQRSVVACAYGTDMSVADLFFNTPVRKKFLKQDETEWNAIQAVMYAFGFSHPSIHFKIYRDEKLVLNAPAVTTEKERALQLWDHDIAHGLLSLTPATEEPSTKSEVSLRGVISHPQVWRYGRSHIFLFVNGRWVKNTELAKALLKGYAGVLPPERFPGALIFIDVDPQHLDVNIHPKKEEVKFARPGVVQTALTTAVKKTLEQYVVSNVSRVVPQPASYQRGGHTSLPPMFQGNFDRIPHQLYGAPLSSVPSLAALQADNGARTHSADALPHYQPMQDIVQIPLVMEQVASAGTIIGQLFNTYIILEKDDAVIFIDQHAAHERIIYERLKKNFEEQHGTTLLFPEMLTLTSEHVAVLIQHKDFFEQQGITFDAVGPEKIIIRSTPAQVRGEALTEFINDTAQFIIEHESLDRSLFTTTLNEHMHAQLACKSAVKAGDVLSHEQMKKLLDDLEQVDNRFICVHGRPTMWRIEKSEVEKKFRRT
jgi:DNA mismatch repair protein MutL